MPLVHARYDVELAPITVSWTQEVIEDDDAGDFYVKLTPHVEYGTAPTRSTPQLLASIARQKQAEQGKRIAKQINDEILRHTQNRLKAEYNRRRGQRWNKKV